MREAELEPCSPKSGTPRLAAAPSRGRIRKDLSSGPPDPDYHLDLRLLASRLEGKGFCCSQTPVEGCSSRGNTFTQCEGLSG